MKRFYLITRDLHLYFGLFISPLLLLFSVSVFFLVHAWIPSGLENAGSRTVSDLPIPEGLERLNAREQVDALRPLLDRIGAHGEVNIIRRIVKENKLVLSMVVPGREVNVDLDLGARSAVVKERSNSAWNATVYLHKMPGQHLAMLRGNWGFMRAWKFLADGTVYVTLFLTISGVYLWAVLRAERRVGLVMLAAGTISFFGLAYAVIH